MIFLLSVVFFVGFVDLGHNNSQTLMSLFSYNSISLYIYIEKISDLTGKKSKSEDKLFCWITLTGLIYIYEVLYYYF